MNAARALKQALAATELFFSDDLAKADTAALALALDAQADSADSGQLPSMVTRLALADILGSPLERFLIASTLVESKSQSLLSRASSIPELTYLPATAQARKAIEAGMITLNGVKLKAKSHQRVIEEGDVLPGGLIVLRLGKLVNKAVLLQ